MRIHLLAKMYLWPQKQHCGILAVTCRHAQSGGQSELSAEVEEGDALPSCFNFSTVSKQVSCSSSSQCRIFQVPAGDLAV